MMRLKPGAAGGMAAARAMADYLQEKQLPDDTLRAAEYYGQTKGAEAAIKAGEGCAPTPRPDMAPEVAAALGIDQTRPLKTKELASLLAGQRADWAAIEGHQRGVGTYDGGETGKVRYEIAYYDMVLSAPKSLSVAWALAGTEAERASLLACHRTAVAETMAYVEEQVGTARMGKGGLGGRERARFGWVTCDHYTARPTTERVATDPATGEQYTEVRSLRMTGDPQLHTHAIVPNVQVTESGRVVALDSMAFHGRIHEFGAVYQAIVARDLRRMGVDAEYDERTKLSRLPAVPEWVCDEFSKRHRDAEGAARAQAKAAGQDYDTLTPEQRSPFLAYGAAATRQDKGSNRPDMDAWRDQAERIGWRQQSVVAYGPPTAPQTRAERMTAADTAALPHLAEMLQQRAVIGQGDARLAAARGFIAAGIDSTDDLRAMMGQWATGGVLQDGKWTQLMWREGAGNQVRLTTELHRDQEGALIALARDAATDRTHALTPAKVEAAVGRSGLNFTGEHGQAQRNAIDAMGTDGALSVVIGVAGSGKTAALRPLVDAWQAAGMEVWGSSQARRQADALQDAGIPRARTRALQPFLDGVSESRTPVGKNSVVVLDELGQIGTRQLLDLLRLREKHGFKIVAIGDNRQCQSIEAGPVIELLRQALGSERIPEILSTVRQQAEEERRIAALFRDGKAPEAIAAKRDAGTAELVAGGYQAAVERVADLYAERRAATHNRGQDYRITISAPTNADAREIGRAVRDRRRAMGEVGARDRVEVAATDGQGDAYKLRLTDGDNVRLFQRTHGVGLDDARQHVHVGNNGSVVRVRAVVPDQGIVVADKDGRDVLVAWKSLTDKATNRLLLAYGDCLTIDSSQGITSDEHINALPGGSRAAPAGKAYVAESRHRVTSWLVGSMGAEMREARERRPSGLPVPTPKEGETAAWANLARNLGRVTEKESALAFLQKTAQRKRASVSAFQTTMRTHEAREAAGLSATTVRQRQEERMVAAALPAMQAATRAMEVQQLAVRASLSAVAAYHSHREWRRVDVAARLVGEGRLGYQDAVARLVQASLADQRRGVTPDPIHGLRAAPAGSEAADAIEARVERRLEKAISGYDEFAAGARETAAKAARVQSSAAARP